MGRVPVKESSDRDRELRFGTLSKVVGIVPVMPGLMSIQNSTNSIGVEKKRSEPWTRYDNTTTAFQCIANTTALTDVGQLHESVIQISLQVSIIHIEKFKIGQIEKTVGHCRIVRVSSDMQIVQV